MPSPHFIVHEANDNVGVIVVEDAQNGQNLSGWIMATDASPAITANAAIPIGHKIALRDLQAGDAAIKYGQDIGKIIAPVKAGDHVHTHNLKTKRW